MKAIIIEEERFAEVSVLMDAECERISTNSNTPDRLGWSREVWKEAVREAHRTIHYIFVKWAQSHGASCI